MTINLSVPSNNDTPDLKPRITVLGVGGGGGNAVNNMIRSELEGVDFVVANTDAQALAQARTDSRIQMGTTITRGLGAGSRPDIGRAAAEETMEEIVERLKDSNMVFVAAGMGGGTGTGAAPVIARAAREHGILTVGVVTKPFHFEGVHRMKVAEAGIEELEQFVDTLIIIPNQNLFRVANEKTTFADAFSMADEVLYSGVRGVTDLIVMPGLINLDFADIRSVMSEMGKAMMGTGEAEGERRALDAAEAAISNPLLDDTSMKGAKGILINITGGLDMTLFEVDEAANRIRAEVDNEGYIVFGSTFSEDLEGKIRVSVVATGIDAQAAAQSAPAVLSVVDRDAPSLAQMPDAEAPEHKSATVVKMVPPAAAATEPAASLSETPGPAPEKPAASGPAADKAAAGKTAVRPPATPALGSTDIFIPPPAEPSGGNADKPAVSPPAAQAPDRPSDRRMARDRGPTLFERVTGTGRAARSAKAAAVDGDGAAQRHPTGGRGRLGGLDSAERVAVAQAEEDLLDIPAFLRRQAN